MVLDDFINIIHAIDPAAARYEALTLTRFTPN